MGIQVKVGGQDREHPPPLDFTSTHTSPAVQEGAHAPPASPASSPVPTAPSAPTQTAPNKPGFRHVSPTGQDPQSIRPPQPFGACPQRTPEQFVGRHVRTVTTSPPLPSRTDPSPAALASPALPSFGLWPPPSVPGPPSPDPSPEPLAPPHSASANGKRDK